PPLFRSTANFSILISVSYQPFSANQLIFRYHLTTTSNHYCYYYKYQKFPAKFHTSTLLILHAFYSPKIRSSFFLSLIKSPISKLLFIHIGFIRVIFCSLYSGRNKMSLGTSLLPINRTLAFIFKSVNLDYLVIIHCIFKIFEQH